MPKLSEFERKQRAREAIKAAAREPARRFDPATGGEIVTFNDLADYLERHGLKVIRMEWPQGAPRPTFYTARILASG